MLGKLYIVATPIGNLEDITVRAKRILGEVDLIAAEDTRQTRKLLSHLDIHTKLMSFSEHHERKKLDSVIEMLLDGKEIALVSDAGTPCISDPGYPLLERAIKDGIEVIPIPGACAAITALSAAGLPTDAFTFIGFLPEKSGKREKLLSELKSYEHTLVFYLSKWKAKKHISDMCKIFGDRRAVLCRELTKIYEEFDRSTLFALLEKVQNKPPKGELVLIVSSDRQG